MQCNGVEAAISRMGRTGTYSSIEELNLGRWWTIADNTFPTMIRKKSKLAIGQFLGALRGFEQFEIK